jgi:hypothetical protein
MSGTRCTTSLLRLLAKKRMLYAIYLGDFCQKSYQLARLFARPLCCAKGYIAGLCAPLRALQADENPAQSGNCFSSIRLRDFRRRWLSYVSDVEHQRTDLLTSKQVTAPQTVDVLAL